MLLISAFNSKDINNALWGYKGFYLGAFLVLVATLAIYVFKDLKIESKYYLPVIISITIINLIAILHSFEIDVLKLHYNILDVSYHKYLSTIGNINWYAGFLSLVVPLFACLYLLEDKYHCLYLIASYTSVMVVGLLGSDSIYLGLGSVSFFIIPTIFESKKTLKRFSSLLLVFDLALIIARKLLYCMDGYSGELRRLAIIIPLLMIAIVLLLFAHLIKEDYYLKISKKLIIACEIILVSILFIFIFLNIRKGDYSWTTGRIPLWQDSLKIFNNFKPFNKLLGIGLENLYLIYGPINERYQAIYLSSHSEWIELLLTGGYLAFFSYLSIYLLILFTYFKSKNKRKLTPFGMSFIAYFGQSLVNSSTVTSVMLLTIILIVYLQNLNQ